MFSGAGATQAENTTLFDEFLQHDAAAVGGAAWSFDDVLNDPMRLDALPFPALDDGCAPQARDAGWRCLEAKHAASCTACTQPPALSQESRVMLSIAGGHGDGSGGSGRGLNALRAALLLSPEWNSSAAREAAAVALEAALAGGPLADLPAVLRSKGARALKKGHLIALCRHWPERQPDKTPLEIGGHYRQVPSTCSKRREARKLSARPPSWPCCALGARRGAKRPASGRTDAELPMDPLDIVTARARSTAVPVASVLRRFPSALGAVPQRQHDAAPPLAPAPRITHHTQLQRLPWARAHAPAARRAAFCAF